MSDSWINKTQSDMTILSITWPHIFKSWLASALKGTRDTLLQMWQPLKCTQHFANTLHHGLSLNCRLKPLRSSSSLCLCGNIVSSQLFSSSFLWLSVKLEKSMHCMFPRKSQSYILLYVRHKSPVCFRNVSVSSLLFPIGKEMPWRLSPYKKPLLVSVVLCSFLTAS